MKMKSLAELYVAELEELANAEDQLAEVLLELAEVASNQKLKSALSDHREETLVHQQRLESLLTEHRAHANAHTDQARPLSMKREKCWRSWKETSFAMQR